MKIAVMGTGGLGGYFGGRLAHAGLDVTFIARGQHLQAIRENGLQVKSPNGDFVVSPAQATDNPAEVGVVDLILFCVKAYDAVSAAEQMKPMVGPQTVIIPVLNGIDHVEKISAVVGAEHVLGGWAVISAHLDAPGVIQHLALHDLYFGEVDGGHSARVDLIQRTLAVDSLNALAEPNILLGMWRKYVGICGVGVFSVARGNGAVVLGTPETIDLIHQCMLEVVAVGQAKGVAIDNSVADYWMNFTHSLPPHYKPSMLVDLEHGRRLEVESLNGAVSRMGKELGVPTPVNDFIYACLKPWANSAQKS